MSHAVHLRRAVGWFLVALLGTAVLLNLIGFASPFWGHWRYPGDAGQTRALLDAIAPWTAGLSLLFLLPAWHVSRTLVSPLARGIVLMSGVLVVIADVAVPLAPRMIDDPIVAHMVSSLAAGYPFLAFMVFTWLVWRALRIEAPPQTAPGAR